MSLKMREEKDEQFLRILFLGLLLAELLAFASDISVSTVAIIANLPTLVLCIIGLALARSIKCGELNERIFNGAAPLIVLLFVYIWVLKAVYLSSSTYLTEVITRLYVMTFISLMIAGAVALIVGAFGNSILKMRANSC